MEYTGPVRRREGGDDIENIVTHKIGIQAHETDPISRRIETEREKITQVLGGFDVMILGDKSGSMSGTVDGEEKWKMQRRVVYLLFSSLHRFEQSLERIKTRLKNPLSVRTQGISFRNEDDIDEDKPLSTEFSAIDKVRLWKSLGNQGSGNGDVVGLQYFYNQIKKDRDEAERRGDKDDRLRIIFACSDGAPDSVEKVHQMVGALGKELEAVVVGIGITESARAVPAIFTTDYSVGDIAENIDDLPIVVARHVVENAVRLFPEKASQSMKPQIEKILAKFRKQVVS